MFTLMRRRSEPDSEEDKESTSDLVTAFISWTVYQFVYLLLAALVAFYYKQHKDWFLGQEIVKPSEKDFKQWTSPMLEPTLLWSCLCPGVRWADSMSMARVLPSYWRGFFYYFVMSMISGLCFGLPGWILLSCFMTYFRMHLRIKFEMDRSLFCDFCGYFWCLPCLVAQEARHVEDAHLAGRLSEEA